MNNKINAYKELLKVVNKHSDVFEEHLLVPRKNQIEGAIKTFELSERFGIPLKHLGSSGQNYYPVNNGYDEWSGIIFAEEGLIGCSDNGEQPQGEWLFRISFGCGPYIFGDYMSSVYPQNTFKALFDELKTYNPKYIDSANKSLYFTKETAKYVYQNFWSIFDKYKAQVNNEMKEKRKAELEKELAELKGE